MNANWLFTIGIFVIIFSLIFWFWREERRIAKRHAKRQRTWEEAEAEFRARLERERTPGVVPFYASPEARKRVAGSHPALGAPYGDDSHIHAHRDQEDAGMLAAWMFVDEVERSRNKNSDQVADGAVTGEVGIVAHGHKNPDGTESASVKIVAMGSHDDRGPNRAHDGWERQAIGTPIPAISLDDDDYDRRRHTPPEPVHFASDQSLPEVEASSPDTDSGSTDSGGGDSGTD